MRNENDKAAGIEARVDLPLDRPGSVRNFYG
jgi:hypothetical protein